jgi:hypothetical protein
MSVSLRCHCQRAQDATLPPQPPPRSHPICPSIPRSFVVKTFTLHTQESLACFAPYTLSRESRANLCSVETSRSVSELPNAAIRGEPAEDAQDLSAFDARKNEPTIAFEDFVKELKRNGKI